jgi:c(7)-type cytochrome triheme protein
MRTSSLFAVVLAFLTAATASAIDLRDYNYDTKNAGKVVFSHKLHLQKAGIKNNCKTCHDAIFDIKNKSVHYTMADMYKGKSCGACHGKSAFKLQQCARCHQVKEIKYQVKATGLTRFSHKTHLAAYNDCSACHPAIFAAGANKHVSMAEMEKGKSCGACHGAKNAPKRAFPLTACTKCHPVKELTFITKEAGNVPFSHNIHTSLFKCGDCHTKLFGTFRSKTKVSMKEMEAGKSCGACHNDKGTKKAFALTACTKCHPVKEITFIEKDAGNVLFSHKNHTGLYACGECHTKLFGTTRSKTKVSMKAMEAGKSCGACHDGKTAFSVATDKDCDKCHKM